MNQPTRTETNETPGQLICTFDVYVEPEDLAWEDLVDTGVCGETPPPGTEAWWVRVVAHYCVEHLGKKHYFSGEDSLGGILVDQSSEQQVYLQEQIGGIKANAYGALLEDIEAVSAGAEVKEAEAHRDAARLVYFPDPELEQGKRRASRSS